MGSVLFRQVIVGTPLAASTLPIPSLFLRQPYFTIRLSIKPASFSHRFTALSINS